MDEAVPRTRQRTRPCIFSTENAPDTIFFDRRAIQRGKRRKQYEMCTYSSIGLRMLDRSREMERHPLCLIPEHFIKKACFRKHLQITPSLLNEVEHPVDWNGKLGGSRFSFRWVLTQGVVGRNHCDYYDRRAILYVH